MHEYLFVIASTVIVYLFLISAIVFFGKKEISQLSIIDLVFILLISNSVQNAMVNGDWRSLLLGLAAALTLFCINYSMKLLIYKSAYFNKLVESDPVLLIYEGRLVDENLRSQRITLNEIQSAVRQHGVGDLSEVSLAMLEPDGNISVISYDQKKVTMFARPKQKISKK